VDASGACIRPRSRRSGRSPGGDTACWRRVVSFDAQLEREAGGRGLCHQIRDDRGADAAPLDFGQQLNAAQFDGIGRADGPHSADGPAADLDHAGRAVGIAPRICSSIHSVKASRHCGSSKCAGRRPCARVASTTTSARNPTSASAAGRKQWLSTRACSHGGPAEILPFSPDPSHRQVGACDPRRAGAFAASGSGPSVSAAEPGGLGVAQARAGAISHPGDVPVRPDQHGGRGAD
jgi:hypothetical protein